MTTSIVPVGSALEASVFSAQGPRVIVWPFLSQLSESGGQLRRYVVAVASAPRTLPWRVMASEGTRRRSLTDVDILALEDGDG